MTYYSMVLTYHGGKCCGVKTVWNLGYAPDNLITAIDQENTGHLTDGSGASVGKRFDKRARKTEAAGVRMDAIIAYYKEQRKSGILELVIQTPIKPDIPNVYYGQAKWIPWLLSRGFKEVNAHYNSNSTNICRQFVLNIGDSPEPIIPAEEWWAYYEAQTAPDFDDDGFYDDFEEEYDDED